MKIKVLNGLPLSAISGEFCFARRINLESAKSLLESHEVESYVGHQDTAVILSSILGKNIAFNRANAELTKDDLVLVCAYKGPRLPEGTTTLPQGATFDFWLVTLKR